MNEYLIQKETLDDIASAIQEKAAPAQDFTVADFGDLIRGIKMNDANTSAFLELMLSVISNNTPEIHSSQLVGITRLNKTYLFGYLNYLTLIDLYDSDITVFGRSTFYGCGSLTKAVLPKNLNNGGASLFGACANLREVYLPDVPFTLGSTGAFPISNEGFKFYVSSEEVKALYTDSNLTNWNTYSADLFEVRARE